MEVSQEKQQQKRAFLKETAAGGRCPKRKSSRI
jgi:hypothetical protein